MNKTEELENKISGRKQSIKNINFQIKTLAASIRHNKDLILRHKDEIKELEKELAGYSCSNCKYEDIHGICRHPDNIYDGSYCDDGSAWKEKP